MSLTVKPYRRIRVVVPEIRNETEFAAWCATTQGTKAAARITQPVYLKDTRDYTIGGTDANQCLFARLSCEGNGRLEWPGVVQTTNKRILVYAKHFRFDNVELTGYEARNAMVKLLDANAITHPMLSGSFKGCNFHDWCTQVGADRDHHSSGIQGGELNSAAITIENCTFSDNAQGNAQYSHPIYLSPAETLIVRNNTFTNSGSLALQKLDGIPAATCQVYNNTFNQSGSQSWYWWTSQSAGELRNYAYAFLVYKNSNYDTHDNIISGDYEGMIDGYFQDLITFAITFDNNTYNMRLVNVNQFAKQQGGSWYSEATWQSTFNFDLNSTFNLSTIPA